MSQKDGYPSKHPAPGKWSIREIVAHVGDTELVVGYRIRAILGAPGSQVLGFDQDVWVTALHYEKRTRGNHWSNTALCGMPM